MRILTLEHRRPVSRIVLDLALSEDLITNLEDAEPSNYVRLGYVVAGDTLDRWNLSRAFLDDVVAYCVDMERAAMPLDVIEIMNDCTDLVQESHRRDLC